MNGGLDIEQHGSTEKFESNRLGRQKKGTVVLQLFGRKGKEEMMWVRGRGGDKASDEARSIQDVRKRKGQGK